MTSDITPYVPPLIDPTELAKGRATRQHADDYLNGHIIDFTADASPNRTLEMARMIAISEAWDSINDTALDDYEGDSIRLLLEQVDDWDDDPNLIYMTAMYRNTMLTHPDLHRLDNEWLRTCRKANDLKTQHLAKRLKVANSSVARWEVGLRKVSATNHRKLRIVFVEHWTEEKTQWKTLLTYRAVQEIAHRNGDSPFIGLETTADGLMLNWTTINNYLDHEDDIDGEPVHRQIQAFANLYIARNGIPRPPWVDAENEIEAAGYGDPRTGYWPIHVAQKYRLKKIDGYLETPYHEGGEPVADNGSGNVTT